MLSTVLKSSHQKAPTSITKAINSISSSSINRSTTLTTPHPHPCSTINCLSRIDPLLAVAFLPMDPFRAMLLFTEAQRSQTRLHRAAPRRPVMAPTFQYHGITCTAVRASCKSTLIRAAFHGFVDFELDFATWSIVLLSLYLLHSSQTPRKRTSTTIFCKLASKAPVQRPPRPAHPHKSQRRPRIAYDRTMCRSGRELKARMPSRWAST